MKRIIEYLPLLSVCLIYFGFCNLHAYYQEFNIDIYAYITTSEIIMAFFPTLVFVASIASASLIQEVVGKPVVVHVANPQESTEPTSRLMKLWVSASKTLITWLAIYLVLNFAIRWLLIRYFDFKPYDFQTYNIFSGLFLLVTCLGFLAYTDQRDVLYKNPAVVAMILVFFIGSQINSYRRLDADKIKAGMALRELSFRYHNRPVATGRSLMYIGQTSGQLFLYDRKGKSTFVYKTSELDSLVIKH